MDTAQMLERLVPLFEDGQRFDGRYSLAPTHPPREIHASAMWELPVFPAGSQSAELMRIYSFEGTIGPLLQAHWRNETRAVLRLGTRGLSSLPRYLEADFLGRLELGYLILSDSGPPLSEEHEVLTRLQVDRRAAFLQYFAIVEAVAALHEEGLLHRNLTLDAIRVGDENTLVVDGFQMSAFMASWFRPSPELPPALLASSPASRWMLAPERLERLESATHGLLGRGIETFASDVFSLGLIGVALLVGCSAPPSNVTVEAQRQWLDEQTTSLRRAQLPPPLGSVVEQMISRDRRNRPASGVAVHEALADAFSAILHDLEWRAGAVEGQCELLYMKQSIERIYDDSRGKSPPSSPDYREYARYIEDDLRGAMMAWSPDGFEPWERTGDRTVAKDAKVVLLGRVYAYFCAPLNVGRSGEDRSRLVVKHMLPMGKAGALRKSRRQRSVPRIVCGFFRPSSSPPLKVTGARSWEDFVSTVKYEGGRSYADPVVATGRWLLDEQRADARRLWFRVEVCEQVGDRAVVRDIGPAATAPSSGADVDNAFDALWAKDAQPRFMAPSLRRLIEHGPDQDEPPVICLRRERDDREPLATVTLTDRELDRDTCEVRFADQHSELPSTLWLGPDDRGTRTAAARQLDALLELESRYNHLAAQIRTPRAVRLTAPPTTGGHSPPTPASDSDLLLQRLLETWPIFAVQGPPGTGKTWLAAEVISRSLADDPYGRFLIAAQSHQALDNLLEGVMRRNPGASTLRIASESSRDKVRPLAAEYLLPSRLTAALAAIRALDVSRHHGGLRTIIKQWRKRANDRDVELEADLGKRLPRSFSLVFSTAAQASQTALGTSRGAGAFDWVIVEEAARGWVTEFFVPMIHGARWLLVGDQAQLPAHRKHEYDALLLRDIANGITAETTGVAPVPEWREYLDYFGHMMRGADAGAPRAKLTVQRRMHPDIAELIKVFYDGELATASDAHRDHGITSRPFKGTAAVWLDTSGLGAPAYERASKGLINPAELAVLKRYFRNVVGEPKVHEQDIAPLAVLSPYRAQVQYLRDRLGYDQGVVKTVDSFQGGEAEVVLVSLVRHNASEDSGKAIGFLSDPSRVNVMFSRARRLLVVVGALRHFERHGSNSFWEGLARHVRSDRRLLFDVAGDGFTFSGSAP